MEVRRGRHRIIPSRGHGPTPPRSATSRRDPRIRSCCFFGRVVRWTRKSASFLAVTAGDLPFSSINLRTAFARFIRLVGLLMLGSVSPDAVHQVHRLLSPRPRIIFIFIHNLPLSYRPSSPLANFSSYNAQRHVHPSIIPRPRLLRQLRDPAPTAATGLAMWPMWCFGSWLLVSACEVLIFCVATALAGCETPLIF